MNMRTHTPDSRSWPRALLFVLWLSTHISLARSTPGTISPRQTVFDNLKLPPCALTCFVDEVSKDECADDTDFACHCGPGDIMRKTAKCVKQKCNSVEEADATRKVQVACGAQGTDESDAVTSTALVPSSRTISGFITSATSQPAVPSGNGASSPASSRPMSAASSLPNASSMPTNAPLDARPSSSQLSHGAEIGIAVSVSLVALALVLLLGWYILRLKRDLKTAQAHFDTTPEMGATTPPTRWPSTRGHQSPVSPLSPMTVSDNGYGILKKKRGNVLSAVVEQEPEDRNSLMHEPVPGQREGLSQAVELDGEHTGLVEAPLSITPRERSRER